MEQKRTFGSFLLCMIHLFFFFIKETEKILNLKSKVTHTHTNAKCQLSPQAHCLRNHVQYVYGCSVEYNEPTSSSFESGSYFVSAVHSNVGVWEANQVGLLFSSFGDLFLELQELKDLTTFLCRIGILLDRTRVVYRRLQGKIESGRLF